MASGAVAVCAARRTSPLAECISAVRHSHLVEFAQ